MATPSAVNILTKGAVLWYAPVGEAIPDETSIEFGEAWGGNWARVGFTKAPLTCLYEDERFDITVEESPAPVKRVRTSENLTLETVLAELTPDYLDLAVGAGAVTTTAAGASQVAYQEYNVGGSFALEEKAWGFEGEYINSAGVSFPVRFFIYKGTAMVNGPLEFSNRDDVYPGIPIQIKALADTSQSSGSQLLKMQRVTAAATS